MPLYYNVYTNQSIIEEEGTRCGSTFYLDTRAICFRYTTSHKRALFALTNWTDWSADPDKIRVTDVKELMKAKVIKMEWLTRDSVWGAKVYDEEGVFIGEVGIRCSNPAGLGTNHPGEGPCHYHSVRGEQIGKMTHGRFSRAMKARLAERIQEYLAMPDMNSLSRELALQRSLIDELVDKLTDVVDSDDSEASQLKAERLTDRIIRLTDVVGRQVDRMSSISQRGALTAAQVLYIQVTVADIISRYISDPRQRDIAARELAERLGVDGIELSGGVESIPIRLEAKAGREAQFSPV